MVKLNVPLWGQPQRNQCVPTCVKMVLEYLRTKHGDTIPRLTIKRISKMINLQIDGTIPRDVERINAFLSRGNPVVKFKATFLARFPSIVKELEENKNPVIVWINAVEPPDVVWHTVVVTGFDPDTHMVTYNEPYDKSERMEEVGKFSNRWGVEGRMVKVNVFKTQQRQMPEWTSNDVEGETNE